MSVPAHIIGFGKTLPTGKSREYFVLNPDGSTSVHLGSPGLVKGQVVALAALPATEDFAASTRLAGACEEDGSPILVS
jgi:hypothetical protein